MPAYEFGEHIDFTGYLIQSGDEGEMWYKVERCDDGDVCDLCSYIAEYIVVSEDADMPCNVGYCQSCALLEANTQETPDVWHHPQSWAGNRDNRVAMGRGRHASAVHPMRKVVKR